MKAIAGFACVFLALAAQAQDGQQAPDPQMIAEAKALVSRNLKDPGSAQFRGLRVYETKTGAKAVCGEMNAKNSYGGYVGFREFLAASNVVFTDSDSTWSVLKPAICTKPISSEAQ